MLRLKLVTGVVLTLALALLGAGAVIAPAQAATGENNVVTPIGQSSPSFASNCPSGDPLGSLCLYSGSNGSGVRLKYDQWNTGCVNLPASFNDSTSSAVNLLAPTSWHRAVILYFDASCAGSGYIVLSYGWSVNMGLVNDNRVSSVGFLNGPFGA